MLKTLLGRLLAACMLCTAAYLPVVSPAMAQPLDQPVLSVTGTIDPDGFKGAVFALRDPSRTLSPEEVIQPDWMSRFQPVAERAPDFGYTRDVIWLAFTLRNDTDNTTDWRLHFQENFLQLFEVRQLAPDGSLTVREAQSDQTPYDTRRIPYPELVAGLALPPGETTTVLVRYWSGGSSEISFRLMSEDSFAAFAARKTAKNFIYYGMLVFLVATAIIAFTVTGSAVFGAYAAYAGFGLLFVMHGDGNAFQYLWPNLPRFNAFASIPIGTGLVVFGGNFARTFLQTRKHHPVFDAIILGFMFVALALAVSGLVWDEQMAKKWLVLFAMFSMVLYALAGFNAARTRFREVRFYVLAWTGAVVASAIMAGRHWLGLDISEETQFDAMRIVLVMDAGLIGFAILDRFNQLKRTREDALRTSLDNAERTLRLTARLRDLEQKYELAVELAETRKRAVTDVVHDLRTPLHALRLSVQNVTRGQSRGVNAPDIEETFGYLEGLVTEFLERPATDDALLQAEEDAHALEADLCDVDEILSGVIDIHAADASAKGLGLRMVRSGLKTPLPPLVLMRIAANLVSNAVKYTDSGRILVGMRRQGPTLARLEVHDTGPGMSDDSFSEALGRTVRLAASGKVAGSGLGLAIVSGLVKENGLRLSRLPRQGRGTSIAVTIPI